MLQSLILAPDQPRWYINSIGSYLFDFNSKSVLCPCPKQSRPNSLPVMLAKCRNATAKLLQGCPHLQLLLKLLCPLCLSVCMWEAPGAVSSLHFLDWCVWTGTNRQGMLRGVFLEVQETQYEYTITFPIWLELYPCAGPKLPQSCWGWTAWQLTPMHSQDPETRSSFA